MLQIQDIRKKYVTGELVQTALDGVSLTLRDNEFVAILGPSGSGKTTLLNVIGGLDRYDSGDLIINGISTKKYTDRDWDSYRNHTIGFVFQSYNLIPHQTVLANVELALTISGISRGERRKRAIKALEDVGLGNQLHKRPNQMSGGQMQRVAIARALVNNPDILLADEPTGALDSDTSVQIMELLKDVAKDRLVVMVTHNPELAQDYANRIVRVRDGRIIDDTNPYHPEKSTSAPTHKNMGRSSMSFFTALSLSFNNLRTKKARTLLTAFAGSIGIIGIALIMSLSNGFQRYIDQIQEDTLTNYPLVIQSETADMTAAMSAFSVSIAMAQEAEEGTVVEQQMISQMFAQIGSNDLASFKTHLEENYGQVENDLNAVHYSYGVKPLIFSADTSDGLLQVNPGTLFGEMAGGAPMASYMNSDVFHEMIDNIPMLNAQYDVLQGRWPQAYNEMVFVLSSPNQLADYAAYTLGLKDPAGLTDMIRDAMSGQEPKDTGDPLIWSYDDLMALEFRLVDASSLYHYNEEYAVWENMSTDTAYMRSLVDQGEPLRIVGIVCPKEGVSTTVLTAGIAYTPALTQRVVDTAAQSKIVQSQLADMTTDVFTGNPFGQEETQSELRFEDMISVDGDKLTSAFGMNISEESILQLFRTYLQSVAGSLEVETGPAQEEFIQTFSLLAADMLHGYIASHADETGSAVIYLSQVEAIAADYLSSPQANVWINALAQKYQLPADTFTKVYNPLLVGLISGYMASEMEPQLPEPSLPTEPTVPEETVPPETEETVPSEPAETEPTMPSVPEEDTGSILTMDPEVLSASITAEQVDSVVGEYAGCTVVTGTAAVMAGKMMEATVYEQLMAQVSNFGVMITNYIGGSMYVDEEMIASAFQFEMNEEQLRRLMEAMSGSKNQVTAEGNLRALGYADTKKPISISIYMVDFAGKERFLDFLDGYNTDMETAGRKDQVISYTDVTGLMMSSVRTIIDSVSYVLIAFVAVSLIVSSIMIGIITYISVMERTKEIGVLRAIGASKRNISQVFNAETFIIGLCSGLIGVGITLSLNIPINHIIHSVTGNTAINARLPWDSAVILVALSMGLTLVGGLIPSRKAAKKDPVIALRSE